MNCSREAGEETTNARRRDRLAAVSEPAQNARLLDAVARLNAADQPDAVLDVTLAAAAEWIPVHQISIGVNAGDHVLLRHHRVDGVEAADALSLPLDGSISGLVIRDGAPCLCENLEGAPPPLGSGLPWPPNSRPKTLLSVPVAGRSGDVLAALNLFDRIDGAPFSDTDRENAISLAGYAGVALERTMQAADLREHQEFLAALLENSPEIVCVLNRDGTIRYESPSVQALTGVLPEALVGRPATDVVHPDDAGRMRRYFGRVLAGPEPPEPIDYRARYEDGSWHYLEGAVRNLLDQPAVHGVLVTSRDVTARKRAEEQIVRQAFREPVTGLPSRALFMDRLSHALDSSLRRSGEVVVMLAEFSGFHTAWRALGAAAGDAVLQSIASRLCESLRVSDTVACLSAARFALLFEGVQDTRAAGGIAQRLVDACRPPFVVSEQPVTLGLSLGVSIGRPMSGAAKDLLDEAETALDRAKGRGPGRYVIFRTAMSAPPVVRSGPEREFREAIDRGEFVLHYQPEVELRTGRIIGAEALVRWQHPSRGLLPPSSFIPLAEESGAIAPLATWVLEEACWQSAIWQRFAGRRRPLVVGVNFSVHEFQQPDVVEKVARTLRACGLQPSALRLEITESTMMRAAEATVRTLRALKDLGVGLAIDDFGTGYSSLSYLQQFPVDTIKIDQSFVGELGRRAEAREIVRAVTRLARALNMEVTAEGIETVEQKTLLETLHCRRGQGHLFWKPLPSEELTALLESQPRS